MLADIYLSPDACVLQLSLHLWPIAHAVADCSPAIQLELLSYYHSMVDVDYIKWASGLSQPVFSALGSLFVL